MKIIDKLITFFADDLPNGKFLLGYSGGVDSHVLLHAMCQLRQKFPTISVRAIYVDHGLHTESKSWAQHCNNVCLDLGVALQVKTVAVNTYSSAGVEAHARALRYQQFAQVVESGEILLCAHHLNDQAETLLLQTMRGSGIKGLASMPARKSFCGTELVRPLLDVSRQDILHYAKLHALCWVDDSSNAECRFDRNYIRHKVLPLLSERWPAAIDCLTRVANNCADSQMLLKQLAQIDLQACHKLAGDCQSYSFFGQTIASSLALVGVRALPDLRRNNLLRYWLAAHNIPMPSRKVLQSLDAILLNTRPDAQGKVVIAVEHAGLIQNQAAGSYVLRVWNNFLFIEFADDQQHSVDLIIPWTLYDDLTLPNSLGVIRAAAVSHFFAEGTDSKYFEIRFRRGGETIRLPGETFHRCLKKCFQMWGVPPWWRERIPLLYYKGELLAVIELSAMA